MDSEKFWKDRAEDALIGRKIVGIQYMTKSNAEESGWYNRPIFLILDDGSILFPQSDDEGNDGGALGFCATDKKLNTDGYNHSPIFPTLRN